MVSGASAHKEDEISKTSLKNKLFVVICSIPLKRIYDIIHTVYNNVQNGPECY